MCAATAPGIRIAAAKDWMNGARVFRAQQPQGRKGKGEMAGKRVRRGGPTRAGRIASAGKRRTSLEGLTDLAREAMGWSRPKSPDSRLRPRPASRARGPRGNCDASRHRLVERAR